MQTLAMPSQIGVAVVVAPELIGVTGAGMERRRSENASIRLGCIDL
ncbi:hypothetical protein [Caulobacter sp. Root655]|nr:hypothetical protein [Caulobacter sp. Root655]